MSPLFALLPAALCTRLLRRRRAPVERSAHMPVMYAGHPEPTPLDWQAIEPRWDCQNCRSIQAAEVHPDWFLCLHCGIETPTAYA